MDFKTTRKIMEAVKNILGYEDIDSLVIDDIDCAWVLTDNRDLNTVGGLRLVVHKTENLYYQIPSSYCADNINGISGFYAITLTQNAMDLKDISVAIAKHVELSKIDIYKCLRNEGKINNVFITSPKILEKDIGEYLTRVHINRNPGPI